MITPLFYSLRNNKKDCFLLLLDFNADPNQEI